MGRPVRVRYGCPSPIRRSPAGGHVPAREHVHAITELGQVLGHLSDVNVLAAGVHPAHHAQRRGVLADKCNSPAHSSPPTGWGSRASRGSNRPAGNVRQCLFPVPAKPLDTEPC